jgi:hypothetical protein
MIVSDITTENLFTFDSAVHSNAEMHGICSTFKYIAITSFFYCTFVPAQRIIGEVVSNHTETLASCFALTLRLVASARAMRWLAA